ncbi:hypothetical protein HKX54_07265 [Sulfitobacter sp. M57]|uniref:hypothetical protein n=1 Tax=unclassified Sulfitobacter TaxID=196795 RepID=UPI0023E2BC0B|nr:MULTISPECIES: hypothetical protein [unclassified Sulfitobacter]MDF3414250.1 hypothetical protein [Sulfitobacter sp. KE5]MDF3420468.1 hypothetical protein [Sulfitobacter sp. KE43]MDF3432796.1 hypothetical protein [Sulfitobacter sp. KE42]MDF3458436.1 hypothetical protein [Sulfitobacter sp. S74]MDF3462336.1 hypothetical protein [Sulfitobacter sp. Ks18]
MKPLAALFLAFAPITASACGAPVCLVDPDSLSLTRVITFEGERAGGGPGHKIDDVLPLQGAKFGEHFAGQHIAARGPHDEVKGHALAPLTLMAGLAGQNLSLVNFQGNNVLNGYGRAGFPKRDAQGEGAIAVQFDQDQSALAFDLRGGEAGTALVHFYRRDGSLITPVPVQPTGEFAVAFLRSGGHADIAGLIITNTDPQGLAIDTLRFGKPPEMS